MKMKMKNPQRMIVVGGVAQKDGQKPDFKMRILDGDDVFQLTLNPCAVLALKDLIDMFIEDSRKGEEVDGFRIIDE